MTLRTVVHGLAVIWAALMLVSLASSFGGDAGDGVEHGLARLASFLTWQAYGLVVAIAGAALTRAAAARGTEQIKIAGYAPLVVSLFVVVAVVLMIAFRVLVQPAFA
jgi:hypothetical protein